VDSITQAALGAAIGDVLFKKRLGSKGAILGALVATIPDLDVFLLPFLDPIERLSMHRGYSHSIILSILCALLLAYVLQRYKWTKEEGFLRLFLFVWLALFTHMLLDAFTSYGTLLFLPFSDTRIGFDSINIVDPFYTLPLLIGLSMSSFHRGSNFFLKNGSKIGLAISSLYLLLTLIVKHDINEKFIHAYEQEGVKIEKMLSMPVGIGSFHWYGVGRTKEGFMIGDFSYLDKDKIKLRFFPANDDLLNPLDPHNVTVMKWFAKDFFHVVEQGDSLFFYNMQVDMQGLYELDGRIAPTRGYFILENKEGGKLIGSGRH
jgi:inner membrane protein